MDDPQPPLRPVSASNIIKEEWDPKSKNIDCLQKNHSRKKAENDSTYEIVYDNWRTIYKMYSMKDKQYEMCL